MDTQLIITDKMIFGGDCTAKINGKTFFVPFMLPAERAFVRITEEKRDYGRAEVVELLEKSPHRVEAPCPHYGECGGCCLQHADSDYQQLLRKTMLKESFTRAGVAAEKIPEIEVIYGKDWEYRNRFQLHSGCLMAKKSSRLIPIKDCPVAVPEIREYIAQTTPPDGRAHIFGINGRVVVAAEKTGKNTGAAVNPAHICEAFLCGKTVRFDVSGFFQSNCSMLEKTLPLIFENLKGERALDMYCGAGTFSLFLTDRFKETVLVEQNRDALMFAEKNLAAAKNPHKSYGISGEKWAALAESKAPFDAAVIDPPRSGIEKAVRNRLLQNKPFLIRYLSCDPSTMARDAVQLLSGGYRLTRLIMADFYPQTGHIEALGYFELH